MLAVDASGTVIAAGNAGTCDADVIQQAVDHCFPGGEIRIMHGRYVLEKSILLDFPVTLSGEGRSTILTPPPGEFAVRAMRTGRSPVQSDWVWGPPTHRQHIPRSLIALVSL